MKKRKFHIQKLVLALMINIISFSAISQTQDSVSYYLNGVRNWFYQQPDILSFRLDNKSPYTIPYNPSIIDKVEYFGQADGINNIYFTPNATLADKQSVYNSIGNTANFEKFFVVPVRAENVNMGHSKNHWMGTDMFINIVFEDPQVTLADVQTFATNYELDIAFAPDPSIIHGVYILEAKKWHTIEDYYDPALTLKLCAMMYENDSSIIKSLAPSLRMFHPDIPNDPLFAGQWWARDNVPYGCLDVEINSTANIDLDCAWNFNHEINDGPSYSGNGLVVGVIDFDGIEITHPDMEGQFLSGWHCLGTSINPFPMNQNLAPVGAQNTSAHLQCVSSVVAAKGDNNEGSIGVAYGAKIKPGLMTGSSAQINALLMKFLIETDDDEVDIINMSFSATGLTLQQAQALPFHQALLDCHEFGRPVPNQDAKGIVLVASMGNHGNANFAPYPAGFGFVFSVAGTNPYDQIKSVGDGFSPATIGQVDWGSNSWQYMDVSAPSICVTATDMTDLEFAQYNYIGYGVGDYYAFGGTSASAPIVSGIAALVLEKDPTLTNLQVYEAIRLSCDKVGGYTYSNNGANGRCDELGFGRVNACGALNILSVLITDKHISEFTAKLNSVVTDNLRITLDKPRSVEAIIYNLTGQVILSKKCSYQTNLLLDLKNQARGMYVLKITDNNNKSLFTSKIMKQ